MKLNGIIFRVTATIDGNTYEVGPIKASEAEKITAWTGYGVREWQAKLVADSDPLAARGLLALMEFRKGNNVRFAQVEIEDVDAVSADYVTEDGKVLSLKQTDSGEVVMVNGAPAILLDGEEVEPVPTVRATSRKTD